jgi:hypothetical protein
VNCGIPINEECLSSRYCIYVKGDDNLERCILDECTKYSGDECSKSNRCGVIEGICKELKNGSVNATISGQVIGGCIY